VAQAPLDPDRLGQQWQPDLARSAVDLDRTEQPAPAPPQHALLAVQHIQGRQPVDGTVTGRPFRVAQPGEAALRDVEDTFAAGRSQVGERGEELARLHRRPL
jgi:hypothetical protein